MVNICTILNYAKKLFFGKIICSTHQKKYFSTILGNFWKIEFLKEYRQALTLQKWWKFVLSQLVLRKYFLAKLFVPLIKESVSPQCYAIFGKLNFWRNIDRRRPYKNGEYLYYHKLCKEIIFWQNYLFHSSKEEFLNNLRQFLENWIFEGISTGADLTKMVKICIISLCAKKIFFDKIICSTHQRKSFSTILRDFWKIELLKEYRQARTLQKWWKFVLSQFVLRKFFLAKLFVPLIKESVSPQCYAIFGKLNFWRNIDRRGPYKNGEYLYYLKLCREIIFWQNYLFHSSKEEFLNNLIFGKLNFWRNINRRGPYKNGENLYYLNLC